MVQRRECEGRQLVGCVQSRFFLADLRDAFFMLAFFFSVERFLEATFLATFFFVRFFAPIAVATLFQTAPGAAVIGAVAVAAAWANSPTKVLVPSAAVFPAATTVPFALAALSRTAAGTAGSRSRRSGVGSSASKSFGSFGGIFSCGCNSFLRTRYDALTRHISTLPPRGHAETTYA